jgi:hypothetical protein
MQEPGTAPKGTPSARTRIWETGEQGEPSDPQIAQMTPIDRAEPTSHLVRPHPSVEKHVAWTTGSRSLQPTDLPAEVRRYGRSTDLFSGLFCST